MTGASAHAVSADTAVKIECPPALLDEVRAAAVEGCLRLVRGGLEVGGILFGTRQGDVVKVQAFRNTPIMYALGPTFLLSPQDRVTFGEVLRSHETDPELKGLEPVGWFVSHPRSDSVSLIENDVAIFEEFFKEPWHTTLVLRPDRSGKARAAFFTRDANGSVATGASPSEVELTPPAREIPDKAPEPAPAPVVAAAAPRNMGMRRRFVFALCAVASFLMGAALTAGYFLGKAARPSPAPALSLTVSEEAQALLLAWNPAAISNGETGTIEVKDSAGSRLLHLTRPQLARGAYPLQRGGDDVSFRMTAYDGRGSILAQATTRFVGPPAGTSPGLEAARAEADRLKQENASLGAELTREKARAKVFQERARVLEKILQAEQSVKGAAK